jgi:cytochrome c oxidase subunit IV
VHFEVLTESMKMAVFWDVVAPCSLVDTDKYFRGANCLHHHPDDSYQTTWWYIPVDSHLLYSVCLFTVRSVEIGSAVVILMIQKDLVCTRVCSCVHARALVCVCGFPNIYTDISSTV